MEKFETKVEKAKAILERLLEPDVSLEESLKLYKEGAGNLKEAQKMLEEAKLLYEEMQEKNTQEEPS